jgi:hypothetical protein
MTDSISNQKAGYRDEIELSELPNEPFVIDPQDQKALLRKIDLHILVSRNRYGF